MDHTHSQLSLGGLYDAYSELLRATKDDPATHDKVKALAHYIPQRAPRDRIRTVVDNSAPHSARIDSSIADYIRENSCGNDWSASTDVVARLQALRERDVPKDEVDAAKNHDAGANSELAERDEKEIAANYEAWTQLLDLMRQVEFGQAINLGQALAPAIASQFQTLTQGRYDAVQFSSQLDTEAVVSGGAASPAERLSVDAREELPPTPPISVPTSLPTTINAGSKSALVIENVKSLLTVTREILKRDGYVVRSAPDCAEGLRLYSLYAPFDVVMIDYCAPQRNRTAIDYLEPQRYGIELAMAIRQINPSQKMIIAAFAYRHEDEVPRPTELKDVPVLVSTVQLRKLLEKLQYWATREEIDQAIAALSPAQWQKLQKFAEWKVRGFGRSAGDKGKDLLQEALLSSFVGAQDNGNGRRWNKRVNFVMHLTGAMRGISSHWKDKADGREILECEAINCDAAGQELSPLDNLGPGDTPDERLRVAVAEGFQPAAERQLLAKQEVERMFRMFKNDKEATVALQGFSVGMKKNEIMQKYELTARQYDAATKRIRVKLSGPRNGGGGAEKHGR
jgi:CheY-like chemotaxis protein